MTLINRVINNYYNFGAAFIKRETRKTMEELFNKTVTVSIRKADREERCVHIFTYSGYITISIGYRVLVCRY